MTRSQWLMIKASVLLSFVYCQTVYGGHMNSQARVERSAVEHLRDHGTYIVYFKSTVTEREMQHYTVVLERKSKLMKEFIVEIIEKLFIINCLTAKLSNKALQWVINQETVLSVKENEYFIVGSENPINSEITSAWHLDKIGLMTLSNKTNSTLTGKSVDVYILDSGIHYEHAEFGGRAHYTGCDPIDKLYHQNQAGRDCEGHGTHVAGLVGGTNTGVANGVTLFSVRILNCALKGTEVSLLHGLMCVVNHRKSRNGTRAVINLSVAGIKTSAAVNKSLQLALNSSIIIAASAGTGDDKFRLVSYDSCKAYPAGYPGVINVGATDLHDNALMGEFDNKIYITNMGNCLDVFAPGYKILSSDICLSLPCPVGNDECMAKKTTCKGVRSGTSQSSPIVSGAVALLLDKCPELTYTEVKNMLRNLVSSSNVQFCKSLMYLRQTISLLDVIITIVNTRDRLLYIGDLSDMNFCNMFNGLPLL